MNGLKITAALVLAVWGGYLLKPELSEPVLPALAGALMIFFAGFIGNSLKGN